MTRHGIKARTAPLLLFSLAAPALLCARPHGQPNKLAIPHPAVMDVRGYQNLLARHRGKPVMVYFWATWCEPCRAEYPMINELAGKYASRGLVMLGFSLDDDAEMSLVRRFLARANPVFANYRKRPGQDELFFHTVNPKWNGAIPATFFYGPDGRQVTRLVGEHSRADFEKAIQNLLELASGRHAAPAPTGRAPRP